MKILLFLSASQLRAIVLLLLSSSLLTIPCLAQSQENHDHDDMKHEPHSQHQQNNIQPEHIHHVHEAGSWMFEYRFMRMKMEELLAGDNDVSAADVAKAGSPYTNSAGGNNMMAPTSMRMDMHMLMGMYSQSDELSWMLMLNYVDNKMDMITMGGARPSMESSGAGDTRIGAMYKLQDKDRSQFLANMELSLPTGSIKETNSQGMLPYAMQTGSGTYDLIPSITYRSNQEEWGWGIQGSYTHRLGKNSQNYALGNRTDGQVWIKLNPRDNTSVTGRIAYSDWQNINGDSDAITIMQRNMSPTFDASNSGGSRWDASIGISHMFDNGHMLGVAYATPIKQKLNGLQMKVKHIYSISWQYMF